jgi:hypothetical protein
MLTDRLGLMLACAMLLPVNGCYTDAAYRECLANAVADYSAWKASLLVLSLNPFHGLNRKGMGDPAFTEQVMLACRQSIG